MVLRSRDGRLHAFSGAGQSILMLPVDVAATWLVDAAGVKPTSERSAQARGGLVSLATFPLLSATAVLLAFALLRALTFTRV